MDSFLLCSFKTLVCFWHPLHTDSTNRAIWGLQIRQGPKHFAASGLHCIALWTEFIWNAKDVIGHSKSSKDSSSRKRAGCTVKSSIVFQGAREGIVLALRWVAQVTGEGMEEAQRAAVNCFHLLFSVNHTTQWVVAMCKHCCLSSGCCSEVTRIVASWGPFPQHLPGALCSFGPSLQPLGSMAMASFPLSALRGADRNTDSSHALMEQIF